MFKYIVDENIELRLRDRKDAKAIFNLIDQNRLYLKQWLPW